MELLYILFLIVSIIAIILVVSIVVMFVYAGYRVLSGKVTPEELKYYEEQRDKRKEKKKKRSSIWGSNASYPKPIRKALGSWF